MSDSSDRALVQAARVRPPRRGQVAALEVDGTARAYDLTGLSIGGADETTSVHVFLALQADGGAIYYYFADSDETVDLDESDVISAGDPLVWSNAQCAMIANGAVHELMIERNKDVFLVVKTTSSATLRVFAASDVL